MEIKTERTHGFRQAVSERVAPLVKELETAVVQRLYDRDMAPGVKTSFRFNDEGRPLHQVLRAAFSAPAAPAALPKELSVVNARKRPGLVVQGLMSLWGVSPRKAQGPLANVAHLTQRAFDSTLFLTFDDGIRLFHADDVHQVTAITTGAYRGHHLFEMKSDVGSGAKHLLIPSGEVARAAKSNPELARALHRSRSP